MMIGGISITTEDGEVRLIESLPFILDLNADVLIYGFNSAHACGYPLEPDEKVIEPIEAAIRTAEPLIAKLLRGSADAYLNSLVVDGGEVGAEQLAQFSGHMTNLKAQLGDRFERLTKIATLHHHIGHLWQQQLEVKVFEAVVDAASLKQALTEFGFDLVLHGHKHTNHVGVDGSLIPVDRRERFSPLCVVSGGTVGGYPRTNDHQSFKVIELIGDKGPRTMARVQEIPLLPRHDPGSVIRNESRIFDISLADRFPHLHEIDQAKEAIDRDLSNRLAPEIHDGENLTIADFTIDNGSRLLFSSDVRYRCYAHIENAGTRVFYEVMQATKALKFGTLARIRWLVTELVESAKTGRPTKIVLLVGNLEDTHYSEAEKPGETERSISKLCDWLGPAVAAKVVEVRTYNYTQSDVATLTAARGM
ncbi:hypothetical protein X739_33010 [Mesorhizobium sp. LNHC220B00]|nr:hypothetical protein X739_33010 [Mesorhizobium sp. LNHC220B00]